MIDIGIEYGKEKSDDFEKRLDKVFERYGLLKEDGVNEILKKQIINHHYGMDILRCLEGYLNLIGKAYNENTIEAHIKNYSEELLYVHSPILIGVNPNPNHQYFGEEYWRAWNIEQIFRAYDLLVEENSHWMDYYTRKDLYENPSECKQFNVLQMVNDLFYYGKISGYEHMDFDDLMKCWDFENDKKIHIKINPNEEIFYLINELDDIKLEICS